MVSINSKTIIRKCPPIKIELKYLINNNLHQHLIRDLIKCAAFFAASIYAARTLSQLDILPGDPVSQSTQVSH